MERRLYYTLAVIASITAVVTSIVLVFLLHDFYSPMVSSIENIKFVFIGILPAIVGLLVFILLFLYLISSILTAKIIEPIKLTTQNIESILSGEKVEIPEVYEELKPFIETIELQKKEIEAYIRKLKEAEKIRREFTANVSHELKTPLTSINGFAEMIETGTAKGEDAMKSAAIIRKEGNRLLDLIDSIIKLSQLEDINVEKEFAPLDIYPVGETVLTNLRPKAKEKNISLSLHGSKTVVEANRRMIEDLLYNLIDNAINYNKPGGEVSINIYPKGDWAVIRVSDTGIGIPVEDQSRIFERFYRVDKSRSKKVGGTGLGLSIVKHIVEFHNGKIDLSSKVGEGTTIEVHLPK
ncbi:MAG: hypothetical protein GX077_05280 [Tissierellia bacterium]|nr:hypothetical protein [Tissierellia bacterium]